MQIKVVAENSLMHIELHSEQETIENLRNLRPAVCNCAFEHISNWPGATGHRQVIQLQILWKKN